MKVRLSNNLFTIFIFQVQPRKFDCGLFDDEVLKHSCCDKTEQKRAQKGVERETNRRDLVRPDIEIVRGSESEEPDSSDVRSTFVAEVTYKQVVFASGAPWTEGVESRGGKDGGRGEEEEGEVLTGEGTLSGKERKEQVMRVWTPSVMLWFCTAIWM